MNRSILDDFSHYSRPSRSSATQNIVSSPPLSLEMQLFNACSRGKGDVAEELLLTSKSTINLHHVVNGYNIAHITAKKGHCGILRLILDKDRSLLYVATDNEEKKICEMIAASEGHLSILEILHEFDEKLQDTSSFSLGSRIVTDSRGNTAIHYCCWNNQLNCCRYLVEICGRNPFQVNNDNIPPIQIAAAGNYTEIVSYLLSLEKDRIQEKEKEKKEEGPDSVENGVDTLDSALPGSLKEQPSISGMNSLLRACEYGSLETIKLLFNNRSTHNIESSNLALVKADNGSGLLHYATKYGHYSVVEFLCSQTNIDINDTNNYGLTALHYACIGYVVLLFCLLPLTFTTYTWCSVLFHCLRSLLFSCVSLFLGVLWILSVCCFL
jgi:ankyrin repeat protein